MKEKEISEDEYKYINLYKIPHIIFFSLLVLSWILLIVTFSGTTYWYKYENSNTNTTVQWRFTEVKIENTTNKENYKAKYTKYGSNESSLFRACIAFTILSFIIVNLVLIGFLFQILQRYIYGKWLIVAMRFLPLIAFLFALLSILIALGFNKAYEKDCDKSSTCFTAIFKGNFKGSNNSGESWGPGVGWITSLIGTCFLFAAAGISIYINKDFIPKFRQYNNDLNEINNSSSSSTTTISANNNSSNNNNNNNNNSSIHVLP
ncbi:hypothetical protein DICPUDRAFT_98036 [Dictyostelium purpureum]|uniref:MARVEL domain-containing protein n=1 Tax=Dictyostelium purpureum TaxID=5786 RepID=F0ZM17_DICPU|nr:uncharacterized protein DICPUDRAFT_98036 [Dictyostelium purpureum]EGC35035.1 hypothetical protein DICPUDRAFT_98036 [Dictyostelium purpureum]|eukprot:XP_003288463.1 hypothetical protein DICPUDRAFT_98036 [Dictyostelium purpureum]